MNKTAGRDILERHGLQPYELILMMAAGLDGVNQYGENIRYAALTLTKLDESLFRRTYAWPEAVQASFSNVSLDDVMSLVPGRYRVGNSGGVIKDLVYEHLLGAAFDANEAATVVSLLKGRELEGVPGVASAEYDPATASHAAKVQEAARLERENLKLPRDKRLTRKEMAKRVFGDGPRADPEGQLRALLREARELGLLPPK